MLFVVVILLRENDTKTWEKTKLGEKKVASIEEKTVFPIINCLH